MDNASLILRGKFGDVGRVSIARGDRFFPVDYDTETSSGSGVRQRVDDAKQAAYDRYFMYRNTAALERIAYFCDTILLGLSYGLILYALCRIIILLRGQKDEL